MLNKIIIVGGGTGNLGGRIIKALLNKEEEVQIPRTGSGQKMLLENIFKKIHQNLSDRNCAKFKFCSFKT